jgi:hypothetical protein
MYNLLLFGIYSYLLSDLHFLPAVLVCQPAQFLLDRFLLLIDKLLLSGLSLCLGSILFAIDLAGFKSGLYRQEDQKNR